MKTNGMGKRIIIFTLIAVIVLTMQGPRVFAESLRPESQSETSEGQAVNQPETTEGRSVNQNDLPEEEQEIQPEITEEETVSQNDLPEKEQEIQSETTEEESVSGNDLAVLQSENQPVVAAEQPDVKAYLELTDEILDECIVRNTTNPPGVTVNLFDYWQSGGPSPDMEIAHDQAWFDEKGNFIRDFFTYEMGISKGHLLRFGYKCVGCDYCKDFGAWNDSMTGKPYEGIVKNKLGSDGFPILNFDMITDENAFGSYGDSDKKEEYLTKSKKQESLAYLFSPKVANSFKAIHRNVQGLFQSDENGYYYYDSRENFASYNKAANSFILYNSPGVAEAEDDNKAKSCGQFFPFNTATQVFDTYTTDYNGNYRLLYVDKEEKGKEYTSYYSDGIGYLQCGAANLNHYLGMTMEFSFQQTKDGYLPNGYPMAFEFSGDDDVWIFIDDVLVADLGGLHGSLLFTINFATGAVNVEGKEHTLLDSFKAAYGENSDLGGIAFRGNTFADDTIHTMKMFYLERGHMASDLSIRFNVRTVPDEPVKEKPPNVPNEDSGETDGTVETDGSVETEESATDPASENTSVAAESILSHSDDHMTLNMTGIPRTGDDSRIEWLIAICIISLSGIGVAVCNIFFVRRKKKNHLSKQ